MVVHQCLGTEFRGTFLTLKPQCLGRRVSDGFVSRQRLFVRIIFPTLLALEVFLAGVGWQVVVEVLVCLEQTAANGALELFKVIL